MTRFAGLLAAALLLAIPAWASDPVAIVAAENFYGDVARQIAGPDAKVASILSNPNEDPHLFEASPSTARALSGADLVIYNGADYDPWMTKLLAAGRSSHRRIIVVADLLHRRTGVNPHLWYDPDTMPALAKAIAAELPGAEPRLQAFLASLQPIDDKVAHMRQAYAGTPVTATEPVFGYMAAAIGLDMHNQRFQLAVMNNTEPSASDTAAFEQDIRRRKVRVLIYNSQATDSSAQRLMHLAEAAKIPIVGVTETEPARKTYQDWMLAELEALDAALSK